MKAEEKLKEINQVFKVCGITLSDIKEQHKTGVLRMNSGINTKSFEVGSMVSSNNFVHNKQKVQKRKRCDLKHSSTMGSKKSLFDKKLTMTSQDSNDKQLDRLSDNSEKHKNEIPSEIKDILIKIVKPPKERDHKSESLADEINSKLIIFDQLFNTKEKDVECNATEYDDTQTNIF